MNQKSVTTSNSHGPLTLVNIMPNEGFVNYRGKHRLYLFFTTKIKSL